MTLAGATENSILQNTQTSIHNSTNRMKIKEIIRLIEENGWYHIETKGSHRHYKHPVKSGKVTVAGKLSDEVARGTLNSILKQAGLK